MLTADQIRQALQQAGGMQWQTPSGATSVPGFNFAQVPAPTPVVAPPRPAFGPMMASIPNGYAEMFARPPQQASVAAPQISAQGAAQAAGPQGGAAQPMLRSVVAARPDYPSPNNANPARVVAPVPRQRPAVQPQTYIIRKGDTLSKIAKMYGTTVKALQKKNGIKNANRIVAGAKIKV